MKKGIRKVIQKIETAIKSYEKSTILILFSAVILVLLTFAARYVINYVQSLNEPAVKVLEWDYQYLDNPNGQLIAEKLEKSSYINPIRKDLSKKYCYLKHTFSKVADDTLLTIKTNYSAIKVVLNGTEIYNNHYGRSPYVGNRYNSVVIEKSTLPQEVEVYISVPFSFEFDVTSSSYSNAQYSLVDWSVITAAVFSALLFVLLVLSVIFSISKRAFSRLILVCIICIIITGTFAFRQMLGLTYIINAPVFLNLLLLAVCLCFAFVTLVLTSVVCKRSRFSFVFSVLSLIAAGLLPVFNIPLILKLLTVISVCLSAAGVFANLGEYDFGIARRIRFTKGVLLASLYISELWLICTILWAFGINGYFEIIAIITTLVFFTTGYISLSEKSAIYLSITNLAESQLLNDTEWIYKIPHIIGEILNQPNEESMLKFAAKQLVIVIEQNAEIQGAVGCCIALNESSGFREIFCENIDEECNYANILKRHVNDPHENNLYFGGTSIDLVLDGDKNVRSIIHFENISGGISPSLENTITVISANLSVIMSYTHNSENNAAQQRIVFSKLSETIETKYQVNPTHFKNVPFITKCICLEMGLSERETSLISEASVLHDLGKIALPSRILQNTGYLSESEKTIIARHTEFGHELLSQFSGDFMEVAAEIARYHHESYDGTGYNKLKGEEIPISARIVTAADVYDALTSKRSYKEAWNKERAREYINEKSGQQFDPEVVAAFNRAFDKIRTIDNSA